MGNVVSYNVESWDDGLLSTLASDKDMCIIISSASVGIGLCHPKSE